MNLNLENKIAVITGGSSGIGLAVARGLAEEKVNLVLCARNEKNVLQKANEISSAFNVKAIGIAADVTSANDIENIINITAGEFNGADILINNAGEGTNEKIMEAPDSKWQYYWELHVMSAIRLARGLAPLMRKKGGGVIINNASICAKQPISYEPIYNVTKAALVMLSKCLSSELIADNIRVNSINPGLVQTSAWKDYAKEKTAGTQTDWQEFLNQIGKENAPIGRFATPEELANFFVFLCSPRSSYCVGSTYYVDGGWLKVVE